MTDAEVKEASDRIDQGIATLNQFLKDCRALSRIAKRYPAGTKLGSAIAHAERVFFSKLEGVGESLGPPADPTDATEPAHVNATRPLRG